MASVFDRLVKSSISEIFSSQLWVDDSDFNKYDIPLVPKTPTAKAIHAKFEDADCDDLYLPGARMSAFRARTRDRFLAWLKTFAYRYHNQMGDLPDFTTVWLDKLQHNEGPIVEIFIQLYKGGAEDDTRKESNKLLTFHLYPSTFVITAHGNHHKYWVDHEFTYMKSIVDTLCKNESSEMSDKHDLDFSDTNYSQFVTMLDLKTDDSQTELKATSSPKTDISETHPKLALQNLVKNDIDREGMAASKLGINKNPLTPDKHADVIASIQILENEMCGLSKTLDKHLENIE